MCRGPHLPLSPAVLRRCCSSVACGGGARAPVEPRDPAVLRVASFDFPESRIAGRAVRRSTCARPVSGSRCCRARHPRGRRAGAAAGPGRPRHRLQPAACSTTSAAARPRRTGRRPRSGPRCARPAVRARALGPGLRAGRGRERFRRPDRLRPPARAEQGSATCASWPAGSASAARRNARSAATACPACARRTA